MLSLLPLNLFFSSPPLLLLLPDLSLDFRICRTSLNFYSLMDVMSVASSSSHIKLMIKGAKYTALIQ